MLLLERFIEVLFKIVVGMLAAWVGLKYAWIDYDHLGAFLSGYFMAAYAWEVLTRTSVK